MKESHFNTASDAALCPHCGQSNQCAIAAGDAAEDCWCMGSTINRELAERYADQKRCLCPRCGRLSGAQISQEEQAQHDFN